MVFPRAILFDMDGTLTRPMLDFARIKAEMGIGDRPILEALRTLTGSQLDAAQAVLDRHEQHAAEHSELSEGCVELLGWLADRSVPTALITRNSRRSVETVLSRHGLSFDCLISREDAPPKPSPAPLLAAMARLACLAGTPLTPDGVWMVGDGQYDIEAGHAARTPTVWLSLGRPRDFDTVPSKTVRDLCELHDLLRAMRA